MGLRDRIERLANTVSELAEACTVEQVRVDAEGNHSSNPPLDDLKTACQALEILVRTLKTFDSLPAQANNDEKTLQKYLK